MKEIRKEINSKGLRTRVDIADLDLHVSKLERKII